MKKFIIKALEKLGVIPPIFKGNQPCYDKYGRFIGWYSRSVASSIFVFCKGKDGEWYVLASERGKEAADFVGCWNCVCGYIDFNETSKEAACRELLEEVGISIDKSCLEFMGYEDDPITANRQNITFRFRAVIEDKTIEDFTFSKTLNEGKEVGEIKWLKIDEINNYKWAFGHEKLIFEFFPKKIS